MFVSGAAGPTTHEDVIAWTEAHPGVPGPVLRDSEEQYLGPAQLETIPWGVLLNSKLEVVEFSSAYSVAGAAYDRFESGAAGP